MVSGPVLNEWAEAMRRCRRTLATGPSSARLERLRELVGTACAQYDKGADRLLTAAAIGSAEVGSDEDKQVTDAISCSTDALNRGGDLLIDAEIEAETLKARTAP